MEAVAAFRDSVEALVSLVKEKCQCEKGNGGQVADIAASTGYLQNGIRYCSVRVKCVGGEEYHLEAYGDEAEALQKEAGRQALALAHL